MPLSAQSQHEKISRDEILVFYILFVEKDTKFNIKLFFCGLEENIWKAKHFGTFRDIYIPPKTFL